MATHPLPLDVEQGRWRWASAAADSGGLGDGGSREERGKGEEKKEIRSPYLARARVERGGGFTRAGGGGWR